MQYIDSVLNKVTMYRLVLYGLLVLCGYALILSSWGLLSFSLTSLVTSFILITVTCYASNILFAKVFRAITNFESFAITSLIIFLVLQPIPSIANAPIVIVVCLLAMLSKYLFAIRAKHIFNPAAIAFVIVGLLGSPIVYWWVGSAAMLPAVCIVGFLIVRKVRRFQMVGAFLLTSLLLIIGRDVTNGSSFIESFFNAFNSWPIIFFATVMLTEPLTTPPQHKLRLVYAGGIGILFSSQFHIGPVFSTPELALVLGNIFSYAVSSKTKLFLHLDKKNELAPHVYEFRFTSGEPLRFKPGQYLEWTLPDKAPDSRGNRRYFTIASSPTEKELALGIRFSEQGSTFKNILSDMHQQTIVAGQLAGDFTLTEDKKQKLVFIAGGIGVTPFRSMIKYLVDMKEKRDIILLYANRSVEHIVYKDLFDQAKKEIGLQTHYIATDKEHVPTSWNGEVGRIDETMLKRLVPDYSVRTFYLSGPNAMVSGYKQLLHDLGIPTKHIVTDYFPGF